MATTRLSYSLGCCGIYLRQTKPDALGHIFCYLECPGCDDKNFCLAIKRQVEEETNRRKQVGEVLHGSGD